MREELTREQIRTARMVAVVADLLQIVLVPTFFPAAISPAVNVIDLVVAVVLLRTVGWHWAFLPTFIAELIPFVDLIPTWTAAVFLATRNQAPAAPLKISVEPPPVPREPRTLPPGGQAPRDSSGS